MASDEGGYDIDKRLGDGGPGVVEETVAEEEGVASSGDGYEEIKHQQI